MIFISISGYSIFVINSFLILNSRIIFDPFHNSKLILKFNVTKSFLWLWPAYPKLTVRWYEAKKLTKRCHLNTSYWNPNYVKFLWEKKNQLEKYSKFPSFIWDLSYLYSRVWQRLPLFLFHLDQYRLHGIPGNLGLKRFNNLVKTLSWIFFKAIWRYYYCWNLHLCRYSLLEYLLPFANKSFILFYYLLVKIQIENLSINLYHRILVLYGFQ